MKVNDITLVKFRKYLEYLYTKNQDNSISTWAAYISSEKVNVTQLQILTKYLSYFNIEIYCSQVEWNLIDYKYIDICLYISKDNVLELEFKVAQVSYQHKYKYDELLNCFKDNTLIKFLL